MVVGGTSSSSFLLLLKALFAVLVSTLLKRASTWGGRGEEGCVCVWRGRVTMRRRGPHPCLPGVPFVILTFHSSMEGDRGKRTAGKNVERDRNGRGTERVCVGRRAYTTHTHTTLTETGRGKKPLDPAILSQR